MSMRRWLFVIPVLAFGLLAAGFYIGLGIDQQVLPSALLDRPPGPRQPGQYIRLLVSALSS
jgi:hypothetical protein